jgi:glycosyltransferase involved in cell wall biosynthesis
MRILIYVPTIIIDRGSGDSRHVYELGENLSKLGNQVGIVCRLAGRSYNGSASVKRVKSPDIRVVSWFWSYIYGLFLGLIVPHARKYDLVYTRGGVSAAAWVISRLARIPYVTEVNGLIREEARMSGVRWWSRAFGYLLNWIESKAYRWSQHVVAVSPQIRQALVADAGIKPAKITVIPNGANTDLFKPMDANDARRQLNLSGGDYFVAFVGSLAAWQGVEYLIKSAPHILEAYPQSKFLIVGDGIMRQGLVELAQRLGVSDRMVFTGRVPYDKVALYMNAGDLCVAPFTRERNEKAVGSPLKIYEYAACGKAMVTARLPGLEFVEQHRLGIMTEPDDPEELANTIMKLLREPELRRQMGENGRKYVVEGHSWGSVAKRVAEVCEQVIEAHGSRQG